MDYLQASKRFDLDKSLKDLLNLDLLDLIDNIHKEITISEGIKTSSKNQDKRDIEYLQNSYISNLKGLAFLLSQGIKPGEIDQNTIIAFAPILEELVKKGQLKETILNVIK